MRSEAHALRVRVPPGGAPQAIDESVAQQKETAMASDTTQTTGSRHRVLKIGLATAGVVILLAGGGTFARWYDSASISAGSVESGELRFDSVGEGVWTDASDGSVITMGAGDNDGGTPEYFDLVPGDTVVYTVPITIQAHGDNLQATLDTNVDELTPYSVLSEFTVSDGQTNRTSRVVTEADDGETFEATLTVTYPFTPNTPHREGQNTSVDLSALEISLSQIDPRA